MALTQTCLHVYCHSSLIVQVSVVLKRTVGDSDVSTTCVEVIFRVKVVFYHQRMVFMSLVVDLIGQLNCHVRLVKGVWFIDMT